VGVLSETQLEEWNQESDPASNSENLNEGRTIAVVDYVYRF
jgi:hypothetical protein